MTAKTDPVVGSETWAVRLNDGATVPVRVDRHAGERGEWHYAHCDAWPGVPYAIHMSGNTARYAVERLVACGIGNADNGEQGCGVREIVAPADDAVDWRARALAAEDRAAGLAVQRAELLDIARGLSETGDAMRVQWTAAEAERDEARRLLAAAARGGLRTCEGCGTRLATMETADGSAVPTCDRCLDDDVAEWGADRAQWRDLPHAAALRAAMGGAA